MTPDEEKSTRMIREIIQELRATEPEPQERRRKIDWNQIILLVIAVCTAIWAAFNFFFNAQTAPLRQDMALMKQAQTHIKSNVDSGFKQLNKKIDLIMGATAGVSPEKNNQMEESGILDIEILRSK